MGSRGPQPKLKLKSEALDSIEPPDWLLDADALCYWTRHASQLVENQLLTAQTVDSFALLCDLWAKTKAMSGAQVNRQYLDTVRAFTSLAKLFRLMPSEKPNVKEDRFADYLELDA